MYKMELCKNSFFLTQQVMNLFKITTIAMYAGMAVMTRAEGGREQDYFATIRLSFLHRTGVM